LGLASLWGNDFDGFTAWAGDYAAAIRHRCGERRPETPPGALLDSDYVAKLAKAGFEDTAIEPTRVYDIEDARETCPVFFGKAQKLHHDFEDPAAVGGG
jgi:hypothetical protein